MKAWGWLHRQTQLLGVYPFFYITKAFASHITAYCRKCDANRLDLLMKYYTNPKFKLCIDCLLHARIFTFLADSIFSNLELEKDRVKPFFEKPLYNKTLKNLVKGVAKFGINKPFFAGAPIAVVWNFTNQCNLRCSHCYVDAENSLDSCELSTRDCFEVVDKIVEADVAELNFTGGEPLVRKDFFEVARYAREQQLNVTLASNGILLTEENVLKLKKIGVSSVNISLDGVSPKNHERIRNAKGSFDLTVKGIINSVKYGNFSEVIVNTTLTKFTIQEIPKIYEFVKKLGATKYYVSRILPVGRGKEFSKYDASPKEKIGVLRFLYEKFRGSIDGNNEIPALARGMTYYSKVCYEESGGKLFPVCEILTGFEKTHLENFGNNLPNVITALNEYFSGCAAGLFYCGLSPEGEVLPCAPATSMKLGNLLEDNLEDIWLYHPIFKQLRKRNAIRGKCSSCSAKALCGGCRLTSFGTTGDWLASDLSCPF